jgi:subtilisin family serine protease
MTLTPDDDLNETARQRTRDQIGLLRQAFDNKIIVDSHDDADFSFTCSSEHVLVNSVADVRTLRNYFNGRANGNGDDAFPDAGGPDVPSNQPPGRPFRRYILPIRRGSVPGDKGLLATLNELDRDLRPGLAVPDHVVHICPVGSHCPATEPTETGLAQPWPPKVAGSAGRGVRVVVIDTGWYAPQPLPWGHLSGVQGEPEPGGVFNAHNRIRPYAGHGTFVAGVIRSMAPGCTVYVVSLPVNPQLPGGGVFESEMITTLEKALNYKPHLINFSAGCPTRHQRPARAFEQWWGSVLARPIRPKPLVVAAAGNNSSPWGFWPASSDWAVGVGSLDRDGSVSDFSNWGDSVDVYALGRNLVNAFPRGEYKCHEAPNKRDVRNFDNDYARWSGTSFSTPLVTGAIAAAMRPDGAGAPTMTALQAKNAVLALGNPPLLRRAVRARHVPVVGDDFLAPQP